MKHGLAIVGIVVVVIVSIQFLRDAQAKVVAEGEGVWVARYLFDGVQNSYSNAVARIKEERPMDPAFLAHWSEATKQEKSIGIEAIRLRPERSGLLVVMHDLSIAWIPVADRSSLQVNSASMILPDSRST